MWSLRASGRSCESVPPVSSLTSALQRYDLSGRVVTTDHPPRGIYIQNGKKVVR